MNSPVTPEGKEALRKHDEHIDGLSVEILQMLTFQGPMKISELNKIYPTYNLFDVQEAVWRLLDENKLVLTSDLKLEAQN